ncbi:beta barrel domain-containing protein [Rhodococcus qingshengii]|uniref:beta barrel domain-containing protein n=1 Tax=Rhodococcus qingshengii TaxID=334542 RepID=UPI0035E1FBD9
MNASMLDAKVGDTVVMTGSRRAETHREVRIVKVGRVYVYVSDYGRQTAFYRSNGAERSEYGSCRNIYLPDDWAALQRRKEVTDRLTRVHGIRGSEYAFRQPTDILESILKILDREAIA